MKDTTKETLKKVVMDIIAPTVALVGTWVLGVVTGTKDAVKQLGNSDPRSVVVWSIFCFAAGFFSCWFILRVWGDYSSRSREKKLREDAIKRLPHLPYSMRAILQDAFRDGGYIADRNDPNEITLAEHGYLEMPPEDASGEVTFLIQPWFWEYVDKNWEKLFPGEFRLAVEES